MILHKRWGEVVRLGNFLFKYASLMGISKKYETDFYVPNHYMFDYFKHKPMIDDGINFDIEIYENRHSYDPENLENYKNDFKNKNVNFALNYFLQSPKYWEGNESYVNEMFSFNDGIVDKIKETYKVSLSKKNIGISIRRGDFVNHRGFWQLPVEFYLYSLLKYFPDWEDYNLILFCDDYQWIRNTFKGDNVYYSDGNFVNGDYNKNPMDQLIYGSLCDNFIISNSTFSWWLGYLAINCKNNKGKVIHSGKNLNNHLLNGSDTNDYYHKDWIKSDFFDLTDFDFNELKKIKILI
jgi:hypothetical protein